MAEAYPAAHQLAAAVGSAARLAAHHSGDCIGVGNGSVEADFARYAAHGWRASLCKTRVMDLNERSVFILTTAPGQISSRLSKCVPV
jgi:hypothetical protein